MLEAKMNNFRFSGRRTLIRIHDKNCFDLTALTKSTVILDQHFYSYDIVKYKKAH